MKRANLAPNDASLIPQPTYVDLWQAFVNGAKEGQKHPQASEYILNRSADAYCKLWHLNVDPKNFADFHGLSKQNEEK